MAKVRITISKHDVVTQFDNWLNPNYDDDRGNAIEIIPEDAFYFLRALGIEVVDED